MTDDWCHDCDELRARLDTNNDAFMEIELLLRRTDLTDTETVDGIGAIISNGPLDTAPGGRREDECARLRGALEAIARHCKLGGTEAGWTAYAVRDTLRVCERALGGPPMSLAKHDADCIRRGDHLPTSLCTCGLTDEQVARARGENP